MTQDRIPGRVELEQQSAAPEEKIREPGRVEQAVETMAEPQSAAAQLAVQPKPSLWGRALVWLALSVLVWLLVSAALGLVQLWHAHWWLALGLAGLLLVTVVQLALVVLSEWRASKRLDLVAQRQQLFEQARQQDDLTLFSRQLASLREQLQPQYPQQLNDYQQELGSRDTVAARMQLAENTWLAELDRQAEALIKREALTVGTAVALVPHPLLDALVVLWRSQRMIRQLGQLYGLQPTGLSSWKLLKTAVLNSLLAGAVETASELLAEQAGYGMVETAVGKGAVQGVVMGQRMRRLGRQAQLLCRPWPKPVAS